MAKITMKSSVSVAENFEDYILTRKAKGLADKTLTTYTQHFSAICKHLDADKPIDKLTKTDLDEMIASMRDAGLSSNSISSYVRTMKAYLSWCNAERITRVNLPLYKAEETVKDTYTDEELEILLKKPNIRRCTFAEYRSWVIVNVLVNNGIRAASVRNIQNRDVDLDNYVIYLRHTKSKKAQTVPLCDILCNILREYVRIRGGEPDDYFFPNDNGGQLTENGLRCSIAAYNKRRGVHKTSIHLFRHTFARKYLVDCGGNAFTLQRLLGHSTLDMTKHYCAIFDADIVKNYDRFSPLAQIKSNSGRVSMDAARK